MEEEGTAVCLQVGVPYSWESQSTVQIHGGTLLLNEDGFFSILEEKRPAFFTKFGLWTSTPKNMEP